MKPWMMRSILGVASVLSLYAATLEEPPRITQSEKGVRISQGQTGIAPVFTLFGLGCGLLAVGIREPGDRKVHRMDNVNLTSDSPNPDPAEPDVPPELALPQVSYKKQSSPDSEALSRIACTDKHISIVTKTGGGKTMLLKFLLSEIFSNYQGNVEFFILDPKNSLWMGLESTTHFCYPANLTQGKEFIDLVDDLLQERIGRRDSHSHPVYLICDEWFSFLSAVELADRNMYKQIKSSINRLVAMGREYNVRIILVSQTSNCSEIGLSARMRDNLNWIALGREGANNDVGFLPIEKFIGDANFLAEDDRNRLKSELEQAKKKSKSLGDIPVFLATAGVPVVGIVPDLSDFSFKFPAKWLQVFRDELDAREVLERAFSLEAAEREVVFHEPLEPSTGGSSEDCEPYELGSERGKNVADRCSDTQLCELVRALKASGNTKEYIISVLWGVSKGGSKRYQVASDRYDEIVSGL